MVVIASTVAFPEKDRHALGHVDAHEVVEPAYHGGDSGQRDRLRYWVIAQILLPEGCDLEIELHHEGPI